MVIAQVTVIPLGTATPSLSPYVRDVLRALDNFPNVKKYVGPNGTALEGELDEIWRAVRAMHEAPFAAGVQRVLTLVNIDDRRDKEVTTAQKVAAVEG